MAVAHALAIGAEWILIALVLAGALPQVAASWQFLLVAAHFRRQHYGSCAPVFPRLAVLIPAWNEGAVIGSSIDRLLAADYPPRGLRVYVVDDASTDDTPAVVKAKEAQYPGRVVHLRREHGGQGKAHTLNHGLAVILGEEWTEALLITDADVIFEPACLRTMASHLADPRVGAVTAYIKEGSYPGNYMTRFIGYEYITAQAAARRGQNVLGAVACLAGGAQLHSRANLVALGGRIDTSSLAEDTFTTFETQLRGRRVLFEPHAVCWAEEPGSVGALWKQRLRWARGNVRVTSRYRRVWFRPSRAHRLGGVSFGVFWFCLFLQPVFMITSSAALLILYFADAAQAWPAFRVLWILNAISYLFITGFALLIDPQAGRRTWRQALLFPGVVNLAIIAYTCTPRLWRDGIHALASEAHISLAHVDWGRPVIYAWLAGSMAVAYLAKVIEPRRYGRFFSPALVYVAGYGSLLCACTLAAYVLELRGAEQKWDKTEKTGKVMMPASRASQLSQDGPRNSGSRPGRRSGTKEGSP
jgi:cellulose synthase/poly-beta-1,6-N-acetylglucosamine synthase-like glycosyltransferase